MGTKNTLSGNYIAIFSFLLSLVVIVFSPSSLFAQASLAAEDKIDEVRVTVNGAEESFTVVRDAIIPEQWYYIPDRPRLFERAVDGKREPEFALIRYQFKSPDNPQELSEGGLMQFAASLAIPPEALPQLEKVIREKVGNDKPIRLAAMPFKEAKVNLYTPGEGKFLAEAAKGAGIAPTFATQKMAFSVLITRTGSDVYDEIVNGNTGVPVVVEFTYNGLTPPAGFKVEVDWDQTYKYYSRNDKFAASVGWPGIFGGNADVNRQKIREDLEQNKCIKVMVTEGEKLTAEQINKQLDPILARINSELLDIKAPDKINPSIAGNVEISKSNYVSLGYSVAIKDITQVKKGKEVIDFNFRQHVTRTSLAVGFIGIGRYSEEIKSKIVTVVPDGPWKSAFFVLPAVGDGAELGINQVDLEIGLSDGKQVRQSQVVVWQPQTGWIDRGGKPRTVLTFSLMGLESSGFNIKDAKFESKAQITLKREVLAVNQSFNVFDGEKAVATPLAAVDVVSVDGSVLSWNRINPQSALAAVNVRLQSGARSFAGALKPRNVNGSWIEPTPIYWLVEKNAEPVTALIRFALNSGKMIDWPYNGKNIQDELSSLEVLLVDGNWQANSNE